MIGTNLQGRNRLKNTENRSVAAKSSGKGQTGNFGFAVVQSLSRVPLLWPHGLQHTRLPCPSPSPGACSNSHPLSQWCHPTILSCHPFLLLPSILPSIRVSSNESALHFKWPKYWSFSISPFNEYLGLIFFRIDWFDLLDVQGTLQGSSPVPQFKSINSSAVSLPYGPTLTSVHNYWKIHSCEYTDLCQQMFTHKFHWKGVEIYFPFPVNPTSPEGKYE